MNTAERSQLATSAGRGKNKAKRSLSPQALARMHKGRPPKYPEAAILAERAGVTYFHALKIVKGERSSCIAEMLPAIRAELAAKGGSR